MIGLGLTDAEYWTGLIAWANCAKQAIPFTSTDLNNPQVPYDANGYPLSIPANTTIWTAIFVGNQSYKAGDYEVEWDGDGDLVFQWAGRQFTKTGSNSGVLRVEIGEAIRMGISRTNSANPIKNIRVWLPGHKGKVWHDQFITELKGFKYLRFMNWLKTNENAGNPHKMGSWGPNRPKPEDFSYVGENGVPWEVMIDLANFTKINPYFNIRHITAETDYQAIAQLIKTRLDPSLVAYVSLSNEVWNMSAAFNQAFYWYEKANSQYEEGLKLFVEQLGRMLTVFKGVLGERCFGLLEWHSHNTGYAQFMHQHLERTHPEHVASIQGMQVGPYFGNFIDDDLWVNGTKNQILARLRDWGSHISKWQETTWDSFNQKVGPSWIDYCDQKGLKRGAYEMGIHTLVRNNWTTNYNVQALARINQAQNWPELEDLVKDYLTELKRHLNGPMCWFLGPVDGWSKWGPWGLQEKHGVPSPKSRAVTAMLDSSGGGGGGGSGMSEWSRIVELDFHAPQDLDLVKLEVYLSNKQADTSLILISLLKNGVVARKIAADMKHVQIV